MRVMASFPLKTAVTALAFLLVAPAVGHCGSSTNSGDQNQAYQRRMSGDVRPLEVVMSQSQSLGTVLDARLIGNSYRLKILSSSGHVRTVFVDATTGSRSQSGSSAGGGRGGSDGGSGEGGSDSGGDKSGSGDGSKSGSDRGSGQGGGEGGSGNGGGKGGGEGGLGSGGGKGGGND